MNAQSDKYTSLLSLMYYRWRLAEFDVAEFEMTEDIEKSLKEKQLGNRVPVPFNKGVKKEVEVLQ